MDPPEKRATDLFTNSSHMTKETRYSTIPCSEKLSLIQNCLSDKKGRDLLILDVSEESCVCEGLIIVTATSLRHGQGLADTVLEICRQENIEFLNIEGYAVGEWILIDLNDVIVHIFQEEIRDVYKLNDLWPQATTIVGATAAAGNEE